MGPVKKRAASGSKKPSGKSFKKGGKKPFSKKVKAKGSARPKVKKDKPKRSFPLAKIVENEAARLLADDIARVVVDKKGLDVVIVDVRGRASYTDYLVVGTGESDRQLSAIADAIHQALKPAGKAALSTEGEAGGNWVLLDYGDVVTHLFSADVRGFYDLEGMWADAPKLKVTA